MNSGVVYAYINKLNGKMYIGQTTSPERRHKRHMLAQTRCPHFNNAVRKHGPDGFIYEVLADGISSRADLDEAEKYFIWLYRSNKHGYNMTAGGEGVDGDSARRYSLATHRDQAKSKRHWEAMTRLRGRAVVCIEKGLWFPSAEEAARTFDGNGSHIIRVCHGKRTTASGYHWRFAVASESSDTRGLIRTNLAAFEKIPRSEVMKIALSDKEVKKRICIAAARRCRPVFCIERNRTYGSLSEACTENGHPVSCVANLSKAIGNPKRTFAGMHWMSKKMEKPEEVGV